MKLRSRDKKLTFAVTLGGEEELRLVAAIFLSSARPQHFALKASEDNIRVRLKAVAVHESELARGCHSSDNTMGWAEFVKQYNH